MRRRWTQAHENALRLWGLRIGIGIGIGIGNAGDGTFDADPDSDSDPEVRQYLMLFSKQNFFVLGVDSESFLMEDGGNRFGAIEWGASVGLRFERLNFSRWQKSGRDLLNYSRFILPLGVAAVLLTVLGVGWYTQPDRYVYGYAPEQPIPYSHKLHAGVLKIPCLYCHSGALKSRVAGIPPAEKCMNCHRVTKTDSPHIRKLAAVYTSGEPLKWERIHNMPAYVFFDHRPHVSAGVLCQTCHGEVQTMDVVYQNMSMRMGNCLGCHRNPKDALPADAKIQKGPEHCNACHR